MATVKKQFKIAIVDDHNLFRKGLIKLINLGDVKNSYVILFEAENGNDLQQKISRRCMPDIILMDIDMPDMDGFEAVEWLRKYYPDVNILVVSMFESEESILRMMKMGVKGYLSKDIEVEDMHMALESIINKGVYYTDLVSGVMAHSILDNCSDNAKNSKVNELSENELQFIKFACSELTYQQIADKMHLSPKTVDGYRESVFRKLNVKNRVGLALYAVKHGWVKL